jgi:hypothetical protein
MCRRVARPTGQRGRRRRATRQRGAFASSREGGGPPSIRVGRRLSRRGRGRHRRPVLRGGPPHLSALRRSGEAGESRRRKVGALAGCGDLQWGLRVRPPVAGAHRREVYRAAGRNAHSPQIQPHKGSSLCGGGGRGGQMRQREHRLRSGGGGRRHRRWSAALLASGKGKGGRCERFVTAGGCHARARRRVRDKNARRRRGRFL